MDSVGGYGGYGSYSGVDASAPSWAGSTPIDQSSESTPYSDTVAEGDDYSLSGVSSFADQSVGDTDIAADNSEMQDTDALLASDGQTSSGSGGGVGSGSGGSSGSGSGNNVVAAG